MFLKCLRGCLGLNKMRIGVDVGGTTVKIGIVCDYKIIDYYSIKTNKDTLFDDIYNSIKEYVNKNNISIDGIGFGLPGSVSNNYIKALPNVGLYDIDLNKIHNKYFSDIKLYSTNDANCAALGEHINNPKYHSSYLLTLGTGVGGGYVYNDKLVLGATNNCGEVGHMFIGSDFNFKCTCGLTNCLETIASATGITRLYKLYSKNDIAISAKEVFDKARLNDSIAIKVIDIVSKALAHALANIAVTCDVDIFYLAGGVSMAGDILLNNVRKYYKEFAHYGVVNTPIEISSLKEKAGMLGCAYLW